MNERHFRRLFPNASESTVKANCEVCSAKQGERVKAHSLDTSNEGAAQSNQRLVVRFTRCAPRPLDRDNLHSSIKDLLDGLRYAHLIKGDREKDIDLEVTQRKTQPNEEPHTLIEIFYE